MKVTYVLSTRGKYFSTCWHRRQLEMKYVLFCFVCIHTWTHIIQMHVYAPANTHSYAQVCTHVHMPEYAHTRAVVGGPAGQAMARPVLGHANFYFNLKVAKFVRLASIINSSLKYEIFNAHLECIFKSCFLQSHVTWPHISVFVVVEKFGYLLYKSCTEPKRERKDLRIVGVDYLVCV